MGCRLWGRTESDTTEATWHWVGKIPWRRDRIDTPVFLGFPVAQMVKNLPAIGRLGFDPWVGKIAWRRPWAGHLFTVHI